MTATEPGSCTPPTEVCPWTAPTKLRNAFSSLPFNLTNFSIDLDINGVQDGGVWLRSTPVPGTSVGIKGVLLLLKYADFPNSQIYWHIVTDGTSYGEGLNTSPGSFAAGSNPHVHIEVSGDTYSAFVNGSTQPATILTTSAFASGQVALYDFSSQTFDNISLQAPTGAGEIIQSESVPYVQLRWQSAFGAWYQVQCASGKGLNKWIDIGNPQPGTGSEMSAFVEVTRE